MAEQECGCSIIRVGPDISASIGVEIDYCPMHKAAPEMLAALETFTESFGEVTHPPLPGFPDETYISPLAKLIRAEIAEGAAAVIAQARGQEMGA